MTDECLDLTFLKEIWVVLFEAAKHHEGRVHLESVTKTTERWSPWAMSGNSGDRQRNPMRSLISSHENCPRFHV